MSTQPVQCPSDFSGIVSDFSFNGHSVALYGSFHTFIILLLLTRAFSFLLQASCTHRFEEVCHSDCHAIQSAEMGEMRKIFRVDVPFKSWVRGAQRGKSAPGVHWGLVSGCIINIYSMLGCMDISVKQFFK